MTARYQAEPTGLRVAGRLLVPGEYGSCRPAREGGMCGCDEPDDPLWPPAVSYLNGGFLPVAVPVEQD
jgi:hypothetical protein